MSRYTWCYNWKHRYVYRVYTLNTLSKLWEQCWMKCHRDWKGTQNFPIFSTFPLPSIVQTFSNRFIARMKADVPMMFPVDAVKSIYICIRAHMHPRICGHVNASKLVLFTPRNKMFIVANSIDKEKWFDSSVFTFSSWNLICNLNSFKLIQYISNEYCILWIFLYQNRTKFLPNKQLFKNYKSKIFTLLSLLGRE